MKLKERLRGIVAAVATAALALSVAPVTAMAETWTGSQQGSILIQNAGIDPSVTHVSVYKVASISTDDHNELVYTPETGVESAFTAWKNANGSATSAQTLVDAVTDAGLADRNANNTLATQSGNDVLISDLDAGVYYVQIADTATTSFQSIIVALEPQPVENGAGWTIDQAKIGVKSSPKAIEKTIVSVEGKDGVSADGSDAGTDGKYEVGDTVNYQVSFSVGKTMTSFWLDDTMSDGLTFQNDVAISADNGSIKLVSGTDFNVYTSDQFDDQGIDSEATFRVVLTATGIEKIGGRDDVVMTYSAEINESASVADGTNRVISSVNAGGDDVTLDFAGIKVKKVDADNENQLLDGAVFGLYSDESCSEESLITTAETVNGIADFGLLLDSSKTYYVQEISAPDGYVYSGAVITVDSSSYEGFKPGSVVELKVTNTKSTGLELPSTGGTGTVALTVVGVGLMAGAAFLVMRSRKEN